MTLPSRSDDLTLAEGRFLRLVSRDGWEFAERPGVTGIVVIVPVTRDGELVLVRQLRKPVGRKVIELPAGLVGDKPGEADEDLETAARRELREETGFEAEEWTRLFDGVPSPGISNEVITVFLARGLVKVEEGGGDESEDIETLVWPLDEVEDRIRKAVESGSAYVDPKVFMGLWFARPTAGVRGMWKGRVTTQEIMDLTRGE